MLLVTKDKHVGEMQPEQLWETTMNPESRRLIQITVDDVDKVEEAIKLCMSNDVNARKEYLLGCE